MMVTVGGGMDDNDKDGSDGDSSDGLKRQQ